MLNQPLEPVLLCHRAILMLVCYILATRIGFSTCTKTHDKFSEVLTFPGEEKSSFSTEAT